MKINFDFDCARKNFYCSMYAKIAVQNYCEAKRQYAEIIKNNYDINDVDKQLQMEQHIVVTCVFSAMAIESFLNDYAARRLGDSAFYEDFDRLPTISKFQLISKFILDKDVDKSQGYYANLKALMKLRREYVHNKSEDASYTLLSRDEIEAQHAFREKHPIEEMDVPTLDEAELKRVFDEAKTAIKAMRDICHFFEDADKNSSALVVFFHWFAPEEVRESCFTEVIKEFNI